MSDPGLQGGAPAPEPAFRPALPGYAFRFPRDHGAHDEFQTEWWYYTGHLFTAGGRRYGYELTFFRRAVASRAASENPSRWALRQIYFAHFAITDEPGEQFHFTEKLSRAGIGKAGADPGRLALWIDKWRAVGQGQAHLLYAHDAGKAIELILNPEKPPVVHGVDGISRKGAAAGQASHYYSMTRMRTEGKLALNGKRVAVTGKSWMDHEFGSNQLGENQIGWDWFALQMDDGAELMLYQIRRRDGSIEPASGGTWIPADGSSLHLAQTDIAIKILGEWRSVRSGGRYPSGWRISIPSLRLSIDVTPTIRNQELITRLSTQVTYWEGSVTIHGKRRGVPVSGLGYAELTGYASAIRRL
jgi:predicted secreted hydrolase